MEGFQIDLLDGFLNADLISRMCKSPASVAGLVGWMRVVLKTGVSRGIIAADNLELLLGDVGSGHAEV